MTTPSLGTPTLKVGDTVISKLYPNIYLGTILSKVSQTSNDTFWKIDWSFVGSPEKGKIACCFFERDLILVNRQTPEETEKSHKKSLETRIKQSWNNSNFVKNHPEQAY